MDAYRFYLKLALAGLVVASIFFRWNTWRFWMAAAAGFLASWLVVRFLPEGRRPPGALEKEFEAIRDEISKMRLPEARAKAERLLADSALYRCTTGEPAAKERERLSSLPPSAAEIFTKYARIEQIYGDLVLDRSLVGPSPFGDEFVVCGTTSDTQIAVRRGLEPCYELDGIEPREDLEDPLPSLYHFLLFNSRVVYPDA